MEVNLLHLAVVLAVFAFVYRWITRNNGYFHDKPIPSMAVRFFLGSTGSLMFRKATFSEFFHSAYNKYAGTKVFGMFDTLTPFFVIRDPELIKQIGIKHFDHFVDHRPLFGRDEGHSEQPKSLFRKSVFAMTGQRWKEMRATLSPIFTGSKMRLMFSLMGDCCQQMVEYYREQTKRSGRVEVEVKDMMGRISINVIASCAFGIQVDCLRDQDHKFLHHGRKMMNFARPIVIAKIFAMRMFPKLAARMGIDLLDSEQAEYFTRVFRDTIEARERHGIIRHDMIDLLMEARKGTLKHHQPEKEDQEGFATVQESDVGKVMATKQLTESEMIAQCLGFFLGGFDTVSACATFMVYELVRNPDVQQKLFEEVQETDKELGGKMLSYDVLQTMKYMDMVVSETLRMWPLAPALDRLCTKDYTVDDGQGLRFTIDKGTCVWIPAAGLHHDPQYFPNPERFDPERFNDDNKRNINLGAYLPFGIGPRNCVGSRFALMQVKALIYFILLRFEFVRSANTQIPLQLKKGFTNLNPENGLHVELKLRNVT